MVSSPRNGVRNASQQIGLSNASGSSHGPWSVFALSLFLGGHLRFQEFLFPIRHGRWRHGLGIVRDFRHEGASKEGRRGIGRTGWGGGFVRQEFGAVVRVLGDRVLTARSRGRAGGMISSTMMATFERGISSGTQTELIDPLPESLLITGRCTGVIFGVIHAATHGALEDDGTWKGPHFGLGGGCSSACLLLLLLLLWL